MNALHPTKLSNVNYQVSDLPNDFNHGPIVVLLQLLFYCWMKGGAGSFPNVHSSRTSLWHLSRFEPQLLSFLCGVCVISQCLCGFPPQSIDMQVRWIGYIKLAIGICASECVRELCFVRKGIRHTPPTFSSPPSVYDTSSSYNIHWNPRMRTHRFRNLIYAKSNACADNSYEVDPANKQD